MARLGFGVGWPARWLDGVELTTDEYEQLVQEGAKEAHRILAAQIERSSWKRMSPEQQGDAIRKVYRRTRDIARKRVRLARRTK